MMKVEPVERGCRLQVIGFGLRRVVGRVTLVHVRSWLAEFGDLMPEDDPAVVSG